MLVNSPIPIPGSTTPPKPNNKTTIKINHTPYLRPHILHPTMRKRFKNSLIIITIIALSFGCGWVFDTLFTVYQEKTHPQKYHQEILRFSDEAGIPTVVHQIFATVKVRSDFDSSLVSEDGKIGLFQLTSEQYYSIGEKLGAVTDHGLLYEPNTNLRFGIFWMSELYTKYGPDDNAVFAAMYAGETAVDTWLADPTLTDEYGLLISIPDEETEKYVKKVSKTTEIYKDLYN